MKHYRAHWLVCAGTGCVSCGSFKIKEALEKEIKAKGLADEIQVVATGCNGFCERGPIVMVQPDGIFYQLLKVEDVAMEQAALGSVLPGAMTQSRAGEDRNRVSTAAAMNSINGESRIRPTSEATMSKRRFTVTVQSLLVACFLTASA